MKAMYLFCAAGLLTGCTGNNQQQTIASDQAMCQQMGAVTQEQLFQCVQNQQQIRALQQEQTGRDLALAGTLMKGPPAPPAPQTTTCRPFGNSVQCTTF